MVTGLRIPDDPASQAFFDSLPARGKWRFIMQFFEEAQHFIDEANLWEEDSHLYSKFLKEWCERA